MGLVLPSLNQPLEPGKVIASVPTSRGTELFQFEADSANVSYRLDSPSELVEVTEDGILSVTRDINEFRRFSVTVVVATGEETNCILLSDGSSSCDTFRQFEVIFLGFVGCPPDIDVFESDATAMPLVDSWQAPTLLPETEVLEMTVTGQAVDDKYPFGTTQVTFTTNASADVGSPVCAFEIRVRAGFSTTLSTIGFVDQTPDSLFFFVDGHGITDALHTMPSFTAQPMQPLVASFRPTVDDLPFSLDVPPSMQAQMFVSLRWCETGHEGRPATLSPGGYASVELVGQGSDASSYIAEHINFTDKGSGYYGASADDLGCFRMELNSSLFTQSLRLKRINVVYESAVDRLPKAEDAAFVYRFQRETSLLVRFSPADSEERSSRTDAPRVIIDDVDPPVWQGCPLEPIIVTAPDHSKGAFVDWVPPMAVDDVALDESETKSTHQPGDFFDILGSPHTVVYTATDRSGFQSKCVIVVTVVYGHVESKHFGVMSTSFPQEVTRDAIVRHYKVTQSLAEQPSLGSVSASPFDAHIRDLGIDLDRFTAISVTMALPTGQVQARLVPGARAQVIEVDVSWTASGQHFVGESDPQFRAIPTFSLKDYRQTNEVPRRRSLDGAFGVSVDESLREEHNEFASFESFVDPVNGVISLKAVSRPFEGTFTFSGLTLTIGYPAGANSTDQLTYTLTAGSFVKLKAVFDSMPELDGDAYFLALEDNQPPSINNCPRTFGEVTLPGKDYAFATWELPTFADNRGILKTEFSHSSGDRFDLRPVDQDSDLVTIRAWDYYGNMAECNFTVIVEDAEDPTVWCRESFSRTVQLGSGTSQVLPEEYAPLNTSDNSHWNVTMVRPTGTLILHPGVHEVEVTVNDNWKREASCIVSITIIDDQAPTIECPLLNGVGADPGEDEAVVVWPEPIVDDNHLVARVDASAISGSFFPVGDTIVILTAYDPSGNQASCAFNVSVLASADAQGTFGSTTNTAVIGGAVSAAGLALIAVVVLGLALRRQHAKAKAPQNWEEIFSLMDQFNGEAAGDGPVLPREIGRGAVKLLDELGKGAFGLVSKGILKESAAVPGYLVAVKSLLPNCAASDRQELLEESAVMAQFNHPNVTQLIGVCTVGKELLVVLEYCEMGSLKYFLEKHDEVAEEKKLLFSLDCAAGLAHVHSKGFVHRDVAARNALISSEGRAKIADFGLSRETDDETTYYKSRGGQLPVRWTSPEALEQRKFGQKSDVWGYGIMVYEVFTKAALPYKGMNNQKVWVDVMHGYRLPCPADCPAEVYKMMLSCWNADPHLRPTFDELARRFCCLYTTTTGRPLPEGHISPTAAEAMGQCCEGLESLARSTLRPVAKSKRNSICDVERGEGPGPQDAEVAQPAYVELLSDGPAAFSAPPVAPPVQYDVATAHPPGGWNIYDNATPDSELGLSSPPRPRRTETRRRPGDVCDVVSDQGDGQDGAPRYDVGTAGGACVSNTYAASLEADARKRTLGHDRKQDKRAHAPEVEKARPIDAHDMDASGPPPDLNLYVEPIPISPSGHSSEHLAVDVDFLEAVEHED